MSKVIQYNQYKFSDSDSLLFDTNVWLNLFAPNNRGKQVSLNASNLYSTLLKNKSKVYITSSVVSEFFNSYSRIKFKEKQAIDSNKYKDYKKDFRDTLEFDDIADEILTIIEDELLNPRVTIKLNDDFENMDLNAILKNYESRNIDYNDICNLEICKNNNIKMVTSDSDFIKSKPEIDIIYINRYL